MLQVEDLTKQFHSKTAVNHISFTVKPGVITGLLGPNGAGKTTTMRLITGFLKPTSGKIYYKGEIVPENSNFLKSKLGYLPESAALYPDMFVSEYLDYMADIHSLTGEEKEMRISKMKEICDLNSHLHVPIGNLSKGFKQRVALAGTLIHDPEIIILDEPTSGLDPNQISHIRSVIKNLGKEKTLILSTHILQEVEDICDDVIIISKGSIVANSSVKNLHSKYQVWISIKANLDEVKKIFTSSEFLGVESTNEKPINDYNSFLVTMKDDRPELVFQKLAQSSKEVREIKVYRKSLESIFEELTRN
jgi:ABC-2 type transport system ATP-binding protein